MADQFDEGFYKRADAHIFLSNDQKQDAAPPKRSQPTSN